MNKLDLWLGKNLFQPPIILLCQLTGITQYAVHRYLWWAIMLYMIWRLDSDDHWLVKTALIIFGIFQTISAGLAPNRPLQDNPFLRRFMIVFTALNFVTAALLAKVPNLLLLAMLFAEYALTIRTIPPRESKKAVGKARRVEG